MFKIISKKDKCFTGIVIFKALILCFWLLTISIGYHNNTWQFWTALTIVVAAGLIRSYDDLDTTYFDLINSPIIIIISRLFPQKNDNPKY